jgi:hypothetical protein
MTQAVRNAWPRASKSMPQGLLVPWAKTSKRCVGRVIRQMPASIGTRSVVGRAGLADARSG